MYYQAGQVAALSDIGVKVAGMPRELRQLLQKVKLIKRKDIVPTPMVLRAPNPREYIPNMSTSPLVSANLRAVGKPVVPPDSLELALRMY